MDRFPLTKKLKVHPKYTLMKKVRRDGDLSWSPFAWGPIYKSPPASSDIDEQPTTLDQASSAKFVDAVVTPTPGLTPEGINDWIWRDHIAVGQVSVLVGSSFDHARLVATLIAATAASTGIWPDLSSARANRVLWSSAHLDGQSLLRMRLSGMGAERTLIDILEPEMDQYGLRTLDLSRDVFRVRNRISARPGVRVVVVELADYLGDSEPMVRGLRDPHHRSAPHSRRLSHCSGWALRAPGA
jgi:hypothetical protein